MIQNIKSLAEEDESVEIMTHSFDSDDLEKTKMIEIVKILLFQNILRLSKNIILKVFKYYL